MKKLLLTFVLSFIALAAYSQKGEFKIGLTHGITSVNILSNDKDYFKPGLAFDASFYFFNERDLGGRVIDNIKGGFLIGHYSYSGKTFTEYLGEEPLRIKIPNVSFLPIALAFKTQLDQFYMAMNGGYALGLTSGTKGGLMVQPKVGYAIGDFFGVTANYTIISHTHGNVQTINLGVEVNF